MSLCVSARKKVLPLPTYNHSLNTVVEIGLDPPPLTGGPSSFAFVDTQKMSEILKHRRKTGEPMKYTTEEMSHLIKTQNEFIYIEFWHVFNTDVFLKLSHKLERFSQDAYNAVAHKLLNETSKQPTTAVATEPTTMDACNNAGGYDSGRQDRAKKPPPPPTHWTVSAQPTACESPVVPRGELRAHEGEVNPYPDSAHGKELYAGGNGGGRSSASAPIVGSGGCGSNFGPREILVGHMASDQEGGRRQVREEP